MRRIFPLFPLLHLSDWFGAGLRVHPRDSLPMFARASWDRIGVERDRRRGLWSEYPSLMDMNFGIAFAALNASD